MKKFFALVCMITCIFGLTACGDETALTEYEAVKVAGAEKKAADVIVPLFEMYAENDTTPLEEYTPEEIAHLISEKYDVEVDGNVFRSGLESYSSALESMGEFVDIGQAEAAIHDKQIVVTVQVQGRDKNAEAEVIFSNDVFLNLESAAMNPVSSMGELMGKAALNTVIGMGTVFVVLILISWIIACFGFIPNIQAKFSKKKEAKPSLPAPAAVPAVQAQEDESDDQELIAVIVLFAK